jgi:nucleoside-diphosphate-sugar epimerase
VHALVIGGTGPSGPHVVDGLVSRGHRVTIFHRGQHERAGLDHVEHVHGDPHFRDPVDEALGPRSFDVVIAMYGRVKMLAERLAGRCGQFISVGGVPVYRGFFPRQDMVKLPIPVTEDHLVVDADSDDPAIRFSYRLAEAEAAVFANHPHATVLRFTTIYGPHNARPTEWSVIRRVRDGRRHMILPDGGHQVHTRCSARNAAAFVLAAVDRPDDAAGQVFNCGDPTCWSLREWVELVAELAGGSLELVSMPREIAVEAATTLLPLAGTTAMHCIVSTEKSERVLGYRPVVTPLDALEETVAWYGSDYDFDPKSSPSFLDRFDYRSEDALIDAYHSAGATIMSAVTQHPQAPVHSMPHPRAPGARDHRGR